MLSQCTCLWPQHIEWVLQWAKQNQLTCLEQLLIAGLGKKLWKQTNFPSASKHAVDCVKESAQRQYEHTGLEPLPLIVHQQYTINSSTSSNLFWTFVSKLQVFLTPIMGGGRMCGGILGRHMYATERTHTHP